MVESHTTATGADRFEVRVTADSHFGWIRTRFSLERTIMSWLRTATALIGFGFAIVQYFNHLQEMPGARPAYLPNAPEYLGLALIACGVVALVLAIWQYRWGGSFASIAGMTQEESNRPFWRLPSSSSSLACSPFSPCCFGFRSRSLRKFRPHVRSETAINRRTSKWLSQTNRTS
jgi:putative membrane protein